MPDNLNSAVRKTHRYEPDVNPAYQQLAAHYSVAVVPARPYKPKEKSKAEEGKGVYVLMSGLSREHLSVGA
ncbi:hypothetical protein KOI40_18155 [Aestuariicella sp. G3-2]|uniref:hypothetical protein n=1 Tax=Pseudomaricurvus albidus TaxID=2842452 RepID=UPI001C0B1286|nr:hypothetical protein [Aestuariicella albida]MBU3071754.1 hypothetical protein [Aestuariicella albida]